MLRIKRIGWALGVAPLCICAGFSADLPTAEDATVAKEVALARPRVLFINALRDREVNRPYQGPAEAPSPELGGLIGSTGQRRLVRTSDNWPDVFDYSLCRSLVSQ
jgi:hypothetical protein